jgi:hypothetical protein
METALAEPLAAHVANVNRRRLARQDIEADTLMTDREGRLSGIRLLNLSEEGFMAVTDMDHCERDPVRIDMPVVGWVRAEIIWALGERIGATFCQPLTPSQMIAIVGEVTR